jgi:general secretion pathway protein D
MLQRAVSRAIVAVVLAALVASCATSRAFRRGDIAASAGDWDAAVEHYRQALQDRPDRPEYKIALERAMYAAGALHIDRARKAEAEEKLDEALREYRKVLEYDAGNREIAAKAATIERTLRERLEAAQPKPEIEKLREEARRASAPPLLNPASREPLVVNFVNSGIKDIMNSISGLTGINVVFDQAFQERSTTIRLDGVTLEEALELIMVSNQLFYKVLNPRTILIAADTQQKRQQYEEQVVQTFFLSNADAMEVVQMLNLVIRVPGSGIQPTIAPNKTANTITVRASAPVVQIIEKMVRANDRPRAEVVIDVQILEVSRERAKEYGLDLSAYQAGLIFSPESRPEAAGGDDDDDAASSNLFNLNTISTGISTQDFYLSVPSAMIKFLESDSQTKVLAKPQLRGAEGLEVSVNLGEDVPVPSTTFTPLATGGANTNPLTSFTYRPLGIIVKMTPKVTYGGDVILDVSLENSSRGSDVNIAGQNLPAFNSRKVQTRLRLRDGESNLIAGLLREDERRSLSGFPGIIRLPIVRQLFANNDTNVRQTDIVMLLTPRIVRSHELTAEDLTPIYIGSQGNLGLGGPPPLIAPPEGADAAAPPAGAAPATPPAGAVPVTPGTPFGPPPAPAAVPPGQQVPPGSGPVPGFTSPTPIPGQPGQAVPAQPPPTEPAQPPATPQQNPFAGLVPPRDPGAPTTPPATPPAAPAVPAGQVSLAIPADVRVGGGPYTVPVSLTGASRLSTITLTISYNPAVVRVRSVSEGSMMRQGGVAAAFTQQVDAAAGRVEIAITRTGDQTGVAGSGVLAALVVEPVGAGASSLTLSGVGTLAGGGMAPLQFLPATVTVK